MTILQNSALKISSTFEKLTNIFSKIVFNKIPKVDILLLDDNYANLKFSEIDSQKASKSSDVTHGNIPFSYKESEETTHYSVVDKWGNAVSVTTTINGWYGNGIVVDGPIEVEPTCSDKFMKMNECN